MTTLNLRSSLVRGYWRLEVSTSTVVLDRWWRGLSPTEYVGVDIEPRKFVDVVLPAEKLTEYFGSESFDVVISTELLEHVTRPCNFLPRIRFILMS